MNSFASLLQKFDATLQKYNPVNYKKLQAPLPKKEVDNYLAQFGVGDDEQLKQLFSWKNGFDFSDGEDPHYQIFNFGALLSLEHLNEYVKWMSAEDKDDKGNLLYLPLTANGSGDCILYNLQKEGYGKIHLLCVAVFSIDPPKEYSDSLTDFIETTIAAYEQGIMVYDTADNWLDIDIDAYYSLARQMNPHSDYWQET